MKEQTKRASIPAALSALLALASTGCATTGGTEPEDAAAVEPRSAYEAIRAGDEATRRGDFERALVLYLEATDSEHSVHAWFRVGAVSTHLGRSERALDAYVRTIQLDPMHARAQQGAGLTYMELGQDDTAREYLLRAVSLDSSLWRAHNGLGVLTDRSGDHAVATEHFQAALVLNHGSPMIFNNLGYSRYLSGDLDQAARDFYEATRLNPDYTPAWSNLGMVYAQRKWYFDAVNVLARVMDGAAAYNDVGYIAFRNGDLFDAEYLLSEAIRLSPTYYETAYRNLDVVRATMRGQSNTTGIPLAYERELGSMPTMALPSSKSDSSLRIVVPVGLNVRESGSTEASIVGYLKSGDQVEVHKDTLGWSQVSFAENGGQVSGWVRSTYLAGTPELDGS